MPQLQGSSRPPDFSLLDQILGARESLRQTLFGDQPTFVQKLRAASERMKGQKSSALDPITEEIFKELAMSFNPAAGIYRSIAGNRVANLITPTKMVEQMMAMPNYDRFIQKVRDIVAKSMGDKFQVFRGAPRDEILDLVNAKTIKKAIGVTSSPHVAKSFAGYYPEGHVLSATATPESIMGLVPRRTGKDFTTFPTEQEFIVDPRSLMNVEALSKYIPIYPGSLMTEPAMPDDLITLLLKEAGGRLGSLSR